MKEFPAASSHGAGESPLEEGFPLGRRMEVFSTAPYLLPVNVHLM